MRNSRGMLGFVLDRIEATKFRKNAASCSLGGGSLLGCFFFDESQRFCGDVFCFRDGHLKMLGMLKCWDCLF